VLRSLASRLQLLELLSLHLAAGPDTWVGPSPQACLDDLRSRRNVLLQQADQLRTEARRFERIADELDTTATLTGPR